MSAAEAKHKGRHRPTVRPIAFAVLLMTFLLWVPTALALDPVVDVITTDVTATADATATDATTTDTTATSTATDATTTGTSTTNTTATTSEPAPVVVEQTVTAPEPAPVVQEPVAPAPAEQPIAALQPDPVSAPQPAQETVASVVTEATPAAPLAVIVVVQESPAIAASADASTATLTASDSGPITSSASPATDAAAGPASSLIVDAAASAKTEAEISPITTLLMPIVQTLGTGLTSPYVRPEAFGRQLAPGQSSQAVTTMSRTTSSAPPAQATRVASDLPFGLAAPSGGWSGQGADLLALLMGFLPLGLPDGKSSLNTQTQNALLLMGVLLVVLPFFASPIRDRRRRGPRGFATLALRPG